MRRDVVVLVVVIVAVALMISASVFWSRRAAGPGARLAGAPGLQGNFRGVAAPEFELTSLDGKQVKLSDFRGKAVLLNFWATWCAPCKVEMPWFEELQKKYGNDGLQVVGIAMDDAGPDAVRKFAQEVGASYTILMGKEAVGEAYGGVQFLPTTFFIDRQGKIVERTFGLVSFSEVEGNVKRALNSPRETKQAAAGAPAPQPKPAETR